MYIQIDNAGFINKGAELMLLSIINRLKKEKKLNAIFVKGLNCLGNQEQIMHAGLFQIINLQRLKIKWHNLFDEYRLSQYGLLKKKSVDVILDAGGFQFGDQWAESYSSRKNKELAEYYNSYKLNGAKIIFLPQALGPFKHPLSINRMEIVFKFANMIYAREETSFIILEKLFGKDQKIKLAPDFTSLFTPEISLKLYENVNNKIIIIPNSKMLHKTSNEISEKYPEFLLSIAEFVIRSGEKLILLNHEGKDDLKLIESIYERIKNKDKVEVLDKLNACEVKAVIGHCKLVISSRFHGVISGLNQRVPTLCTSWSHKYEEVLKDFNLSNNQLDPANIESSIQKIQSVLKNPEPYTPTGQIVEKNKELSENMWTEIIEYMNFED